MREWSILPLEEKTALRGYLVQFLTAHPRLINYVRSQLLHTVAVMVKRATLDEDQKKLFDSVLSTMSQLLATDDHKMVREMEGREGEREKEGGRENKYQKRVILIYFPVAASSWLLLTECTTR